MSDTELTVSHLLCIKVDVRGLDFNGVVEAIQAEAGEACSELLGQAMRAAERWARQRQPDRWVNRGQQTRRVRLPWGEVAIRRTRVRDQLTGKTYNLGDRLLGLRPTSVGGCRRFGRPANWRSRCPIGWPGIGGNVLPVGGAA